MPVFLILRMQKEKIGLDIDGTLADFHTVFLKVYNELHKSNYTPDDICDYKPESWRIPMSTPEFLDMHGQIWSNMWEEIKPTIGKETLDSLAETHEVEVITQRPIEQSEYIVKWLKKNFDDADIKVTCVPTIDKKLNYGYKTIFDDANTLAEEIIKRGNNSPVTLCLITQPWNSHHKYERDGKIIRVNDLNSGIEKLLKSEERRVSY